MGLWTVFVYVEMSSQATTLLITFFIRTNDFYLILFYSFLRSFLHLLGSIQGSLIYGIVFSFYTQAQMRERDKVSENIHHFIMNFRSFGLCLVHS